MARRFSPLGLSLLLLSCAHGSAAEAPASVAAAPAVDWRPWDAESFAEARRSGKHVLVSVQAGWCHWCHVMNDETFGDPRVRRLLARHWIAVRVDADARPDLAERFQDYAWPATVLMTPEAEVALPLRGYRPPARFLRLLRAVRSGRRVVDADPPTPEPLALGALREAGRAQLARLYDPAAGGWGSRQKYPYGAPLEHALFEALVRDDAAAARRIAPTLEGHAALLDPVDGGAYQYSLRGVWTRPHYEKIAPVQADVLFAFAAAARLLEEPRWIAPAREVERYLAAQLTAPDGAFWASQDADLDADTPGETYYGWGAERRREAGQPRVDRSVYADRNGRLVVALAELHAATGDPATLERARRAAEAVDGRLRRGDAYLHGEGGRLLHLGDQAWMLRAELALLEATGEGVWRERAARTLRALDALRHPDGGWYAHTEDPEAAGALAERRRPLVLQGVVARGLLRAHRLGLGEGLRADAAAALEAVADRSRLRRRGRRIAELLLALEELEAPWLRVSIVGPEETRTAALHRAALALPLPTRRVELGRPGASRYPYPGEPAAYLCDDEACSLPVHDPAELAGAAERFLDAGRVADPRR